VNRRGERFLNEATPYNDIGKLMYAKHTAGIAVRPRLHDLRRHLPQEVPLRSVLPRLQQPDWMLPKNIKEARYLKKSDTLAGSRPSSASTPLG